MNTTTFKSFDDLGAAMKAAPAESAPAATPAATPDIDVGGLILAITAGLEVTIVKTVKDAMAEVAGSLVTQIEGIKVVTELHDQRLAAAEAAATNFASKLKALEEAAAASAAAASAPVPMSKVAIAVDAAIATAVVGVVAYLAVNQK